jgi:hypothetical protein
VLPKHKDYSIRNEGIRMHEQDEPQLPKLYERIDFERRYLHLAAVVLKKYGSQNPDETNPMAEPVEAYWPKKPEGFHYELRKHTEATMHAPLITYELNHYIDELPKGQPLARYVISIGPFHMSGITLIDIKGHERSTDTDSRKEAARQAMRILMDAAPQEARAHLNTMVNRRFDALVGDYVLSDLAIRGDTEEGDAVNELSDEATNDALVSHLLHDLDVEEEEGAQSVLSDPEAKQVAIDEAINVPPMRSNRRGDFSPVDIITIVKQTASQLQLGWKNTVKPDQ